MNIDPATLIYDFCEVDESHPKWQILATLEEAVYGAFCEKEINELFGKLKRISQYEYHKIKALMYGLEDKTLNNPMLSLFHRRQATESANSHSEKAEALSNEAVDYLGLGLYKTAEKKALESIRIDQDQPEGWINYSLSLQLQGNWCSANKVLIDKFDKNEGFSSILIQALIGDGCRLLTKLPIGKELITTLSDNSKV